MKKKSILRFASNQKALIAVLAMMFLMLFFPTNFYSVFNLMELMNSASILMIVAFGITIVIIAGGIDLSIGGTLVIAGIITIKLMAFLPIWLAIVLAVLTGGLIGAINGYIIVYQKTEPLVVTLGMSLVLTGLAQQLTDAHPLPAEGLKFMMIGNGRVAGHIPNLILIMLVIFAIFFYLLRFTSYGRNMYAIGGNYEVAEYSGIDVLKIQASAYVLCGLAAAFGGVMLSSKLNSGSSIYGDTTALTVISGIVVGGTSLAGGVGSVTKTMLGLLVFAVMQNAMNMLGLDSYLQIILRGVVMVAILSLDSYSRKRKRELV